jgi:hypothetical protein
MTQRMEALSSTKSVLPSPGVVRPNYNIEQNKSYHDLPKRPCLWEFPLAKIADEIEDLGFGRTFELREVLDYPVEIVRAVRAEQGAILRVTVAE